MAIPSKNIRAERITGSLDANGFSISGSLNFTGSLFGTASFATQAQSSVSASYALSSSYAVSASQAQSSVSASYALNATNALTASYLNTLNQDLTFNGNLTLNGTASIANLVVNQIAYSSGSNQLGDAADDTQTLYGTVVIPTGSLTVSGALAVSSSQNSYFIGSGNVGMGTSSPSNTLHVKNLTADPVFIEGQFGNTLLRGHTINFSRVSVNYIYATSVGGSIAFTVNGNPIGSPSMLIDTNGNLGIGIGTTGASSRLQVRGSGTTSATTALRVENTNASASLVVLDNGNVYSNGPGFIASNTAFGFQSLNNPSGSATQNTAFGYQNFSANNYAGYDNVAIGYRAIQNATTGYQNMGIGTETLQFLTAGIGNTAIGHSVLRNITLNSNNTGIGIYALLALGANNGNSNTGIGSNALQLLTTGSSNIVLGTGGGTLRSGSFNIFIAASNPGIITGSGNVIIGNNQSFPSSLNNTIAISDGSGNMRIYVSSSGNIGIGTLSPSYSLDVSGSARITNGLLVNGGITGSFTGSVAAPGATTQIVYNSGSVLGADSGFVYSGSSVGIGTSSPQAAVKLDVNGNIGVATAGAGPSTNTISFTSGRAVFGWNGSINSAFIAAGDTSKNLSFYGDAIFNTPVGRFSGNTGTFIVQYGGTYNDNRYRTQIYARNSDSGSLFVGGTTIATDSIARTMLISSSLTASATSDILVGLDINPTFNSGGFGNVQNVAIRVNSTIQPASSAGAGLGSPSFNFSQGHIRQFLSSAASGFEFYPSWLVKSAQWFSTGNLLLQQGGTFTDTGYRLTVNSSGSASGSLFISGSSSQPLLVVTSSAATALFVSGSGNIGIGTSNPLVSLDIRTSNNSVITPLAIVPNNATTLLVGNVGTNGVLALGQNNTGQAWLQGRSRLAGASANAILLNPLGGNILIGTTTDSARLQVRGSGTTSATTTLRIENTNASASLTITDDLNSQFYGNVGIRRTATASLDVAGTTRLSGSFNTAISGSILTVQGSGSAQPIFTVQGSQGELFSITDSLSGSLFSVNDISGLPILEVFSDNTTLIGNYQDPMLITTAKVVQTNSGSFTVYSLPTASYDTAFFEYSIRSGSNARAGTIMAMQLGSAVNFTETTTTDFGDTTPVSFTVIVTGSNMALTGSSTTGSWTIKTIVRGL
jgi:hypothetical protein